MSKSKKEVSYINLYRKKMDCIPFMEPYLNDIPEIFDTCSSKSREFLISCFTYLDSYFHYLSFLNKDDIDKELLKAAQILKIHPNYLQKSTLFDGCDSSEHHKFWMRLFNQFDIKNKKSEDDFLRTYDVNSKCKEITSIKNALHYFNYEFPVINSANVKKIDLNSEIKKWRTFELPEEMPEENVLDLSSMKEIEDVDIRKPIQDVKYLTIKYDLPTAELYESHNDYEEFFRNFNIAAKNLINYTENMKVIESFYRNNVLKKLSEHDNDFNLSNINQVKRCHELVKRIKSKREGFNK